MAKNPYKFGIPTEKLKTDGVKGRKTMPEKPLDLKQGGARWNKTDLKETFRKAREGRIDVSEISDAGKGGQHA